jgi:tRNA nucleotidyltransferase (CCA-adding enzyme)
MSQELEREVALLAGALPTSLKSTLQKAGELADKMGMALFAVGGMVRDLIMGHPTFDVDLAVEGDIFTFADVLGEALGAEVTRVPRFGTAHLSISSSGASVERIDLAMTRTERYPVWGALPEVAPADLSADLYRRDFTINAMAIRLNGDGLVALVDPFCGRADLAAGQIRTLHDQSFWEDPTRILRAVRFANRYGFQLAPSTAVRAREAVSKGLLFRVSRERLRQELVLILRESKSDEALRQLDDLGVIGQLLPGVTLTDSLLIWLRATDAAQMFGAQRWQVKLLLLLHELPTENGLAVIAGLKLRKEVVQVISQALFAWREALGTLAANSPTNGIIVQQLRNRPGALLALLAIRGTGSAVTRYWAELRHIRLMVNGLDLVEAGVPAGPQVGRILTQLLIDRVEGRAPDRAAQLALGLSYAKEDTSS